MVDLGISRTRDLQGPLPRSARQERARPEPRNRQPRVGTARSPHLAPPEKPAAATPADLEAEVGRLNEILGYSTRIRFVLNRFTCDIRVDLVNVESNQVLKTIPASELSTVSSRLSAGGILIDHRL